MIGVSTKLKRAIARGLLLGLCLLAGLVCVFGVYRLVRDPDVIRIEFDPAVWSHAGRIAWPGSDRRVMVAFDYRPDGLLCGKQLKEFVRKDLSRRRFVPGIGCGHLWVVLPHYPHLDGLTRRERGHLAAHEAFHLAVQLSGTRKVPFDVAITESSDWKGAEFEKVNRFFAEVTAATRGDGAPGSTSCHKLFEAYGVLDERELAYVKFKAHMEWPAEFFMRNNRPELISDQAYEAYRRDKLGYDEKDAVSRNNVLYLAGGFAMQFVDRRLGRQAWQKRYMEGEMPLHMLFEALGCEKPKLGRYDFPATVTTKPAQLTVN